MKISRAVLACLALCFAACGDDDDEPSPGDQCTALIETICDRGVDCSVSEGKLDKSQSAAEYDDCVTEVKNVLDCSRAVDVEPEYPDCIDDLQATSCDVVVGGIESGEGFLPGSCTAVITLK